jgi:CheY-like chemotaxis protein
MSVLIVEDEAIVARNLRIIVEKLGISVCGISSSGKGALEAVDKNRCDLKVILMDITLKGGIDGIETARRIRKEHNAPLVYVTSNKDQSTIDKALKTTNPFAIIDKPFNVGIIESVIRSAFDSEGEAGDVFKGLEKRRFRRVQAAGVPWERVYISTDIHPERAESVILDNASRHGIGVISEGVFHSYFKYRVRIALPSPWGNVSGTIKMRHGHQRGTLVYSGFGLRLDNMDRHMWEGYLRHLSGGNS